MASSGVTKLSLAWDSFDQSMRDNLSRLREASDFCDYWPLIGPDRSRDLNTGLRLVQIDHVTSILTSYLLQASDFSDVTLVPRDEAGPSFPAHRLVLAASSPVFRRILQVRDF